MKVEKGKKETRMRTYSRSTIQGLGDWLFVWSKKNMIDIGKIMRNRDIVKKKHGLAAAVNISR